MQTSACAGGNTLSQIDKQALSIIYVTMKKIVVALIFIFLSTSLFAVPKFTVLEKKGKVRIRNDGSETYELKVGDTFDDGTILRTYRDSWVSFDGNGFYYKVHSTSLLRIEGEPQLIYGKLSKAKTGKYIDLHFYYLPSPAQGKTIKIVVRSRDDPVDVHSSLVRGNANRKIKMYKLDKGRYRGLTGFDCEAPADRYNLTIWARRGDDDFTQVIYPFFLQKTIFERGKVFLPQEKGQLLEPSEQKRTESAVLAKVLSDPGESALWLGSFRHPLEEPDILSRFGKRRTYYVDGRFSRIRHHRGIDYRASRGTEVFAPERGIIVLALKRITTGNTIVIDHGQGVFSLFFHLDTISVSTGDMVQRGNSIGSAGSTGIAVGSHLHWSMVVNGVYVDPDDGVKRIF
jgi:murein DD-endopeptidase MepM/ murein hydrolase activator NlpD